MPAITAQITAPTPIRARLTHPVINAELLRAGMQGAAGVGVPAGGTAGQVLTKASSADNDTVWSSSGASDKTYSQAFISQSTVTVTHNLGKHPSINTFDSAGDEVIGEVEYLSVNEVLVKFTAPFSGTVICN
jgi:hypothetical protein